MTQDLSIQGAIAGDATGAQDLDREPMTFGNTRQPGGVAALEMPRAPLLHEALAAVARDVTAVGKSGKAAGEMGGYAFRKIDDVMNAIHQPMAAHGVLIWYELLTEPVHREWAGKMHRLVVQIEFTFQGPAGDERKVRTWGEALDNGDKGIGKAVSYALKDVLCRLLTLPFSEPENEDTVVPPADYPEERTYPERTVDPSSAPPDPITDEERQAIKDRIGRLSEEQQDELKERWGNLTKANALRPLTHLRRSELPVLEDLLRNVETPMTLDEIRATVEQVAAQMAGPLTEDEEEAPAEDASKGEACVLCGSTRTKLVQVSGQWRCQRASACQDRVAAMTPGRTEDIQPGPALAAPTPEQALAEQTAERTAKRFECVHDLCLAPETCAEWEACAEKPA